MASEPPIPLALLLADEVYQDAVTGKWVIAGIFSQLFGFSLPITHDRLLVFWQVTGVREPVDLRLRVEHCESGDTILELGGPISAKSPLDVISLPVPLTRVRFEKVGKYWFQLISDEQILIQAPLQVTLLEQKGAQDRIEKQ